MGNVSAKQLGMLHIICMYVCMAIYTYMHSIDYGQKSNTHTTLGNILDWGLRLGLGGGVTRVLGCTVTSFKISI
jgi:hypothetical protein